VSVLGRKRSPRARPWEGLGLGDPDLVKRYPLPEPDDDLPEVWAVLLLRHARNKFTPKQREALRLSYIVGLSQAKAAAASRFQPCSQSSYRDRLRSARKHADTILRAERRAQQRDGRVRRPSEVRRGRNRGR
jgi:DNA-directed RNA polymerase specialized sigma24 family protein